MRNVLDWQSLLSSMVVALLAFISPIQTLLIGVGVLIIFDTISGVYVAWKTNTEITSKRFGHIISKMLMYNIAIISGYIVELMIGGGLIPIAKIVAVAISLTELKSISENVFELTGFSFFKYIKAALKRGADTTSQVITDIDNEDDKNS